MLLKIIMIYENSLKKYKNTEKFSYVIFKKTAHKLCLWESDEKGSETNEDVVEWMGIWEEGSEATLLGCYKCSKR